MPYFLRSDSVTKKLQTSNRKHSSVTLADPNTSHYSMTFIQELSAALNDPTVIAAFGKIIADKVSEALNTFEDRLRDCESKLAAKDETIADLKANLNECNQQNDSHEDILDEHEQYSRRNSVRIQHPAWVETPTENCSALVCEYAKSKNINISINDIDACHRVRKKMQNSARPILVKFVRRDNAIAILRTRTAQRIAKSNIYVNEDLTIRRAETAKLARRLAADKKISKSFVLSGKITIETNDGQLLRVISIKQLARYQ